MIHKISNLFWLLPSPYVSETPKADLALSKVVLPIQGYICQRCSIHFFMNYSRNSWVFQATSGMGQILIFFLNYSRKSWVCQAIFGKTVVLIIFLNDSSNS